MKLVARYRIFRRVLLFLLIHVVMSQMSTLYMHTDAPCRAAYLLRLPPPSVALTPEVRCAVVGNVDSGKSTTLGVLTRGMLATDVLCL